MRIVLSCLLCWNVGTVFAVDEKLWWFWSRSMRITFFSMGNVEIHLVVDWERGDSCFYRWRTWGITSLSMRNVGIQVSVDGEREDSPRCRLGTGENNIYIFLCLTKASKILHFTNPQKNPWGKVAGDNRHGQNWPLGMSGMSGDNSSPGIFLRICK